MSRLKKKPIVLAGQTHTGGSTPPVRRAIKLSRLRHLRVELSRVYRLVDGGLIPSSEGTRRAFILKVIGELIVLTELEKRVEQLEHARGIVEVRYQ